MNGRNRHAWRKGKQADGNMNCILLQMQIYSYFSLSSFTCRVEEQTITASDLIQQDIDINEPIGNLKKLLEPRIQMSLDAYEICLQDIQVTTFINRAHQDLLLLPKKTPVQ